MIRCLYCASNCFDIYASVSSLIRPATSKCNITFASRKGGWATRQGIIMLGVIWLMFALSTAHWAADVVLLLQRNEASPVGVDRSWETILTAVARINVSPELLYESGVC